MGTNTTLEDIPAYFVLEFSVQILQSNEKGVGNAILEVSGKLNFY